MNRRFRALLLRTLPGLSLVRQAHGPTPREPDYRTFEDAQSPGAGAAMAGATDRPFRQLCRELGAEQGRPWLFSQIDFYCRYGKLKPAPANHQVRDIMLAHLQNLYRFYGEYTGVRVAQKHLGWYFDACGIQPQVRNEAVRVETAIEQERLVETLFAIGEEYLNPGFNLAA